jgi:hypothetical protein
MIEINENVSVGDLVSVWFSPPWEKSKDKSKKPVESEYKVGERKENWLKLNALGGGYSIIFGKELLETWNGSVRKAK